MIFKTLVNSLEAYSDIGKSVQEVGNIYSDIISTGMSGAMDYEVAIHKLAGATENLNTKNTLQLLSQKGISAEMARGVLATKNLTEEEIKQAMSTYSVAGSQMVATGTTFSLSAAFEGLAASIGLTSLQLGILLGSIAAIGIGIAVYKKLHKTTKQYEDDLRNIKTEYSELKAELQSVNSELQTTRDRMKELASIKSPT